MFKTGSMFAVTLLTAALSTARAQDYGVESIDAAPAADDIPADFVGHFADKGIRIKRGSSRTVCELWFCKQLAVEPDFKATSERLYPFSSGQLIGLLHFRRRGNDFRDQQVSSGWYSLRFGLQPVDGNHVGTSLTRDFLMLINAEEDAPDKKWAVADLYSKSAEAAGSNHPALMNLQKATSGAEATIRHNEEKDFWILHVVGKGKGKAQDIPLDLVVVGHASE